MGVPAVSTPSTDDPCPGPPDGPGGTADGCVVYGKLSRIEVDLVSMTGTEVRRCCLKTGVPSIPATRIGDLDFGQDGYLYVSCGRWGQLQLCRLGPRRRSDQPL